MKIAIIGAGAVGGYFGAKLHESGADITLVARGETLARLRDQGVKVTDKEGERNVAVPVVGSLSELHNIDVVLVATKVVDANIDSLFQGLSDTAVIATTQNAVEIPTLVKKVVGDKVWPGVVRGFMVHTGPGEIEFHGGPLSYTFGDSGALSKDFANALNKAGINGILHSDIWIDVWEKAMFVTTFGGLGAFVDKPLGVLRTHFRTSLESLMLEVFNVARASGVNLPDDAVKRTLVFADQMPEQATSSMQRDVTAGVESELDAQVGAIVRAGDLHEIDTPLHDLIYAGLTLK